MKDIFMLEKNNDIAQAIKNRNKPLNEKKSKDWIKSHLIVSR